MTRGAVGAKIHHKFDWLSEFTRVLCVGECRAVSTQDTAQRPLDAIDASAKSIDRCGFSVGHKKGDSGIASSDIADNDYGVAVRAVLNPDFMAAYAGFSPIVDNLSVDGLLLAGRSAWFGQLRNFGDGEAINISGERQSGHDIRNCPRGLPPMGFRWWKRSSDFRMQPDRHPAPFAPHGRRYLHPIDRPFVPLAAFGAADAYRFDFVKRSVLHA